MKISWMLTGDIVGASMPAKEAPPVPLNTTAGGTRENGHWKCQDQFGGNHLPEFTDYPRDS